MRHLVDKWFVLAVLVVVVAAWMFRYDFEGVPEGRSFAVVLDRWTGEVKALSSTKAVSLGHAWAATD